MTTGELIDRVQSLYSKGTKSDDSRLSSRFIYSKLLSVRAILIKQLRSKNNRLNSDNYTILNCIKLIKVDAINCPCIPVTGCKVYRSEFKIPSIIEERDRLIIEFVSSLDNSVIFTMSDVIKYRFSSGNRFNSNFYIYQNGYIYVYGKKLPKYIMIKAVLENPSETYEGDCEEECIGCGCMSNYDKEFPIQSALIEPMLEFTNKELIGMFSQMREDLSNDNKDSIIGQAK